MWTAIAIKKAHWLASITTKISGTHFTYSDLHVTMKFHLKGLQYIWPIFTKDAKAAAKRRASWCAHILSELKVMTELQFWIICTYGYVQRTNAPRLTTERLEFSTKHFTLHHLRQYIKYKLFYSKLEVIWRSHLPCAQYSRPIFYKKGKEKDGKKDLDAIIRKSVHFIDSCLRRVQQHNPRLRTV